MREHTEEDFVPMSYIEERILYFLSVYPRLSGSMIQVAIGTSIAPVMWRPIIERLIREGKIVLYEIHSRAPSGRDLSHKVYCLKENAPADKQ